jgi:hypothetical protein
MTWFQAHSGAANGGVLAGRLCANRKNLLIQVITGLDCAPGVCTTPTTTTREAKGGENRAEGTHRDSVLGVALDLRQELPCGRVLQAWYLQATSPQQRQHYGTAFGKKQTPETKKKVMTQMERRR